MQEGGLCLHDGQQDEVGEPVAGVDRPQAAQQPIQFGIGGIARRGRAPVHPELFAPDRMAIGDGVAKGLVPFLRSQSGHGAHRGIIPGQTTEVVTTNRSSDRSSDFSRFLGTANL
jgi:hypothetical protein